MEFKFYLCLINVLSSLTHASGDDKYVAAVVNYMPTWGSGTTLSNVRDNVAAYASLIRRASLQSADIVVFPEGGLRPNGEIYPISSSELKVASSCDRANWTIISTLACASNEAGIYTVLSVDVESSNGSTPVTLAFDRNGILVAWHGLGIENQKNWFNTDMGVRIGLLSTWELFSFQPTKSLITDYGVRHFAATVAYTNNLPIWLGIEVQKSWAYQWDSTLLAAGLRAPDKAMSGSGIYQGRQGPQGYTSTMVQNNQMILQTVSKIIDQEPPNTSFYWEQGYSGSGWLKPNQINRHQEINNVAAIDQNIDEFEAYLLTPNKMKLVRTLDHSRKLFTFEYAVSKELCHFKFCCTFNILMDISYASVMDFRQVDPQAYDSFSNQPYKLVAFSGPEVINGHSIPTKQCAIVPHITDLAGEENFSAPQRIEDWTHGTLDEVSTVFRYIAISGEFSNLATPTTLVSGSGNNFGSILHHKYFQFKNNTISSNRTISNLISFGIKEFVSYDLILNDVEVVGDIDKRIVSYHLLHYRQWGHKAPKDRASIF